MWESRGAYRVLVGKPEGRRPRGRNRRRWRIILKLILGKWNAGMDSIDLIQDRGRWQAVLNAVMNLWVP
jgi:hypothetical protein